MSIYIKQILILIATIFCLSTQLLAEQKLKVGVILPLSGPVAPMGESFRRGIELWNEQQPEASSQLEIIYEDHRYDGKSTIGAMQKLVDLDQVELLVVWGNTPSGVIAPIVEQRKIPTILVSMNPDALNREYVVTLNSKVDLLVKHIAKFFEQNHAKRPAAVSIDIGNAVVGVQMLQKALNGKLFEHFVPNDTADFNSTISKLKSKKTDALFLLTMPEQAITFARQASSQKFDIPTIGGDIFADTTFQEKYTEFSSNLAFAYAAVPESFVSELKNKFSNTSYFGESAAGWVAMDVAAKLFKEASSASSKDLFAYLPKINLSNLPLEGLEYSADDQFGRHLKHHVAVYSRKDGKLTKDF